MGVKAEVHAGTHAGDAEEQTSRSLILYIEDEPSDAFFMELAVEEAGNCKLRTVSNGLEALDYLQGRGLYTDRRQFPMPDLVLLDLKLPIISGAVVLEWLREQPHLKDLPVAVFSSSPDVEDRVRAFRMGASDYVTKPSSGLHFRRVLQDLARRWLHPHI